MLVRVRQWIMMIISYLWTLGKKNPRVTFLSFFSNMIWRQWIFFPFWSMSFRFRYFCCFALSLTRHCPLLKKTKQKIISFLFSHLMFPGRCFIFTDYALSIFSGSSCHACTIYRFRFQFVSFAWSAAVVTKMAVSVTHVTHALTEVSWHEAVDDWI